MRNLAILFILWTGAAGLHAETPGVVLFADTFEGEIGGGWSWLREDPEGWRLEDGQLEIRTNGSLWEKSNTQQNILLRDIPVHAATRFAVEVTVDGQLQLDQSYEHGGLIWYLDDDHWVTLTQLNHVEHKTQKILLIHETEARGHARGSKATPYLHRRVDLRLVVEGRSFTAHYRRWSGDPWTELGSITFPQLDKKPRIGLIAGQGPESAVHWVKFDDFEMQRVIPPSAKP